MFFDRINEARRKMTYSDWSIAKLSIITFSLTVAKLWPAVLSLNWYWYAAVFAVTYIYLVIKLFGGPR